jgi:SAM-dependent methyltransferase
LAVGLSLNLWRKRLKKIPFAVPLVRFIRLSFNPQLRSMWRLQRDPQSLMLQPSPLTSPDRYPALFAFVQTQLSGVTGPNILSYGCSTGDEVFSLRRYFPGGQIKGIDINPASLKICRKRLAKSPDSRIRFSCAASPAGEATGQYDAIFCMAVLRHGFLQENMPERCDPPIGFTAAAALVGDLARCLRPGGYIVMQNCHFRFADMPTAQEFDVAWSDHARPRANYPLYGPDNMRLDVPPYIDAIFRKR